MPGLTAAAPLPSRALCTATSSLARAVNFKAQQDLPYVITQALQGKKQEKREG
jgi:hypothetical protein